MLARSIFQKRFCWRSGNGYFLCLTSLPPAAATETAVHFSSAAQTPMNSTFDCSNKLKNMFNGKGHYFSTNAMALVDQQADNVIDIPLAQTGEGIAECELLKWFVNEGDEVEEYQRLCEVQSDKATIEITSRYQGKVVQLLHVPGNIVKVGETLLRVTVDGSQSPFDLRDPSPGSDSTNNLNNKSPELTKIQKSEPLSTPAVRNLAKQHGIDLHNVPGTGKHGRVQKEDVLKYVARNKHDIFNPDSIEPISEAEEDILQVVANESIYQDKTLSIRGYRRAMVKSMTAATTIPHFHYIEEINCDKLGKLKDAFRKHNLDPDIKFTFLPVLIKSLSMALITHPLLNSTFILDRYEVILKGSHNIGIGMATPVGLVVPNIKNVQSHSILEIAKELTRLQNLAKANKLRPEDIRGGTITLSNIGAIGGKYGSPLINVPEAAIIALGRTQKVACFDHDGCVYPVSLMTVNIAADHRILDGGNVAQFCNEWKKLIENPELLLLDMR